MGPESVVWPWAERRERRHLHPLFEFSHHHRLLPYSTHHSPSHPPPEEKKAVGCISLSPTIPPPCSQVSPHEEKGEEKGENKVGEKAFSSPLFLFVRNAAAAAAAAAAATGPRGERAKSGAQGRKEDGLEKNVVCTGRQGGGDTRLIPKSPPLLLLVLVGGWVVVETKGDFQFLRRRDALSRGLGYEAFRTDRPSDHHLPRASAQPSAMPFDFLGKRVQKWTKLDLYLFGP